MKMKKLNPDDLSGSWLVPLHIEYCDDALYSELMELDINTPVGQDEIIERAIVPEFLACRPPGKKSFMRVLDELPDYPEADVRNALWSAGPLTEKLQDYRAFFERVRIRCETLAMSTKA